MCKNIFGRNISFIQSFILETDILPSPVTTKEERFALQVFLCALILRLVCVRIHAQLRENMVRDILIWEDEIIRLCWHPAPSGKEVCTTCTLQLEGVFGNIATCCNGSTVM